ncbi:Lrp/AsnC family transcriptional regulator [Tenacibaculum sp. C7A-26P2]|uniref:Lrp/AsnC family transcriptional regulator n=1 Tax=Tenacibaculum sp. C7A-26P2 TaxID=3447504 RepID=UPI003F850DB3
MDQIDKKILNILQENARMSYSEVAKKVYLSPPALKERIIKMEDHGIIKSYDIKLDYKLLGYDIETFMTVNLFHGKLKSFLSIIKTFPEVKKAYRITGEQNVMLFLVLKDRLHLQEIIDKLMKYGDTKSHIILSEISIEDNYLK